MSGFIQEFQFYMSYPFVRYALIVGVLISLCSSLLGVTLVLKRFSFIGDGLSHVAFGALAIATVLKIANVNIFIMPVTIVCAILLLRTGTNTKLKGDAAIAMLSVGSMAVGYLICVLSILKCIRRCVFHTFWFNINTYTYRFRSRYVCNCFTCSCCIFYNIL